MMTQQLIDWQRQLLALDEMCKYYEQVALPQAKQGREAAWSQYKQGNLNFMEWTILHNQNLQTNTSYLEIVQQYNQLMIQYKTYQP
jgi:cobalt-zinc-cadmium resistance protein CzcA